MRTLLLNPETNWARLSQNTDNPTVQSALSIGMTLWCHQRKWKKIWEPRRGPWYYSRTDYWAQRKRPRMDSPNWYRCIGACHWLRSFACALARSTFPRADWWIIEGDLHSTVIGYSKSSIRVLDFLLWDNYTRMGAKTILQYAGFPDNCEHLTLEQEMAYSKWELEEAERAQAA